MCCIEASASLSLSLTFLSFTIFYSNMDRQRQRWRGGRKVVRGKKEKIDGYMVVGMMATIVLLTMVAVSQDAHLSSN